MWKPCLSGIIGRQAISISPQSTREVTKVKRMTTLGIVIALLVTILVVTPAAAGPPIVVNGGGGGSGVSISYSLSRTYTTSYHWFYAAKGPYDTYIAAYVKVNSNHWTVRQADTISDIYAEYPDYEYPGYTYLVHMLHVYAYTSGSSGQAQNSGAGYTYDNWWLRLRSWGYLGVSYWFYGRQWTDRWDTLLSQ